MVGSKGAQPPDADFQLSKLLDEFRPFLEESLILAILGDYDLSKDDDHESARSALSLLAATAEAEEASCFDPAATGGGPPRDPADALSAQQRGGDLPESSIFSDESSSRPFSSATSLTSPPTAGDPPSSLCPPGTALDGLAVIPDEEKETLLRSMFPHIKEFDISWELKKARGDFESALGALLNVQYLEETGERQRGIDGAFNDDAGPSRQSKKKGKRRGVSAAEGAKTNLRLDIAYNIKPISLEDPESLSSVTSPVGAGPPSIPNRSATASLPPPSTIPKKTPSSPPPPLSDWQTVSARRKPSGANSPAAGAASPFTTAASLRDAAATSFEKAHGAWRRGKSDPLYRSVAVVYAEQGHDLSAAASATQRAAFEARVDAQSTSSMVDLHHVPVREGVEMALSRTRAWWASHAGAEGGAARAAKREPLRVVTGAGHHSAKGVSVLRQSVLAALARDGWAVEAETGQFIVSGRKKP